MKCGMTSPKVKGLFIWRETDVPLAHKIKGFTDGFIPPMLLVKSDLIALIGGGLRYYLALSEAEVIF
jgi:hypothetical protein